jgi:Zn-dependent protease
MPDDWSNFENFNKETDLDIEFLKKQIGQYFPFYDLKYDYRTAAFFCRIDEDTLEENFNSLRKSLSEKNYIPMLRYEKGEHKIFIIKKVIKKEKPIWINLSLLIATIITATLTGSILYIEEFDIWNESFSGLIPNILEVFNVNNLFFGAILFALPLMSILFVHEMGHYYISKKHGIRSSLPFFLPIPPILPSFNIGTFGALISSRDPMPNKKALFDVGIAGPLAGFIVAVPITAIGIATSTIVPISNIESGEPVLGISLLFLIFSRLILNVPAGFGLNLSLVAFAGWVGLLITSINLLPAGQLDGGHIFRAFLGEKQKYAGWIAIFVMILTGWWFFALIIIFMIGMMHPPPLNDITKLDVKRKLLFIVALAILILCYIPYPIYIS